MRLKFFSVIKFQLKMFKDDPTHKLPLPLRKLEDHHFVFFCSLEVQTRSLEDHHPSLCCSLKEVQLSDLRKMIVEVEMKHKLLIFAMMDWRMKDCAIFAKVSSIQIEVE